MPPAEKKDISPTASSQLVTAMITSPPSPTPLETVIIFDWDDTLLASSYLSSKGHRLDNNLERGPELEQQLKELESSVIGVLTLALNFGPVHIVTNAETGWVQMSAQKFIPNVVPLLSKVKVVSARSTYESAFPDAPLKWKYHAFHEKLKENFGESKSEKNVISFGDSYVEREAVRAVTKGWPSTRTKSVKFAERPSMEQLRRQIELVCNCFQYIFSHTGDLDLQLTVTVNSGSNSQPSSPTAQPVTPPSPSQQPVPVPMSIGGAAQLAAQLPLPPPQQLPVTDPLPLRRVTPPTTPTHAPLSAPMPLAAGSAAAAAAAAATAAAVAAAHAAPLAFAHSAGQQRHSVVAPGTPKTGAMAVPKSPAHPSMMAAAGHHHHMAVPPLVPNSPRTTTQQVAGIFGGGVHSPSAAAAHAAAAAAAAAHAAAGGPGTPLKPGPILVPQTPPSLKLGALHGPQPPVFPTAMHSMMTHPAAAAAAAAHAAAVAHAQAQAQAQAQAHAHAQAQAQAQAQSYHNGLPAHMKSAVFAHSGHHHHVPAHAAPVPMAIRS